MSTMRRAMSSVSLNCITLLTSSCWFREVRQGSWGMHTVGILLFLFLSMLFWLASCLDNMHRHWAKSESVRDTERWPIFYVHFRLSSGCIIRGNQVTQYWARTKQQKVVYEIFRMVFVTADFHRFLFFNRKNVPTSCWISFIQPCLFVEWHLHFWCRSMSNCLIIIK